MEGELDLDAKHRKEKKELQAQIQALKKIAKSDKSKKKELTSEIVRLEFELDERHKSEREESASNSNAIVITNDEHNPEPEVIHQKLSKAQKRRDKKSQHEKQVAELIKEQEKENKNGPRNTEIKCIKERLKAKNLQIHLVPSDGDCLYKAVSHQLQSIKGTSNTVQELRVKAASYMKSHKEDFIPFMSNPETFDMLTESEFEEYCKKVENSNDWGGQLEIRALSNVLRCPIKVIQASGPESIDQGEEFEGPALTITYHRHMYSLGEHYNSTEPLVEENED